MGALVILAERELIIAACEWLCVCWQSAIFNIGNETLYSITNKQVVAEKNIKNCVFCSIESSAMLSYSMCGIHL